MADKDEWIVEYTPPTKKELFEGFCYEMFLKYRDEVMAWEKKLPKTTSEEYISKNKSMLKKEFKRQQKKGNF